jgi:crotonobetaine/carnitine-CoA ligase
MLPLSERTVVHMLRRGAELEPDRVAVRDRTTELTYTALLRESGRVGAGLSQLGLGRGEPVLLMLDTHVDHVLSWFGSATLAAVEVPLNTASMPPQIAFIANDCQAQIMLIEEHYVPRLREVAAELPHLRHVVVRGDVTAAEGLPFDVHPISTLLEAGSREPDELKPSDISAIMYTSGTTGNPKGVLVTHAQTYGRNGPLMQGAPQEGDTCLIVLPIYHVIGQCRGLYNALIALGTVVLEERFSASRFWDICREHGVTYVPLVGVMATYVLAQPPRADDADNPVQRIALGTTIPEVETFRARFAVPDLSVSYGLTEAGGVLIGPAESEGCGYLREDFEARLVDEDDNEVPHGEVGELVLRGREPWTTMAGYYNRPEETVAKWRNLWLHTGDLMRRREDGVYVFVNRMSDRIRHKGENISPLAVEAQLKGNPAVADCAVVGVPAADADAAPGDQDLLAAVVPAPGTNVDNRELVEFLATRLPYFSVPRFFRIVEKLPRTDSTLRVQRNVIIAEGTERAWDRVREGLSVSRDGASLAAARRDTRRPD